MLPGSHTGDPYAPWYNHAFVVFDTETTGLQDHDRVVEVGLARFEHGKLVDSWGTLVYPNMEIPDEATAIHGISTADVASAPPFIGALPAVMRLCRDAWPCAYNASFDLKMFRRELSRLRLSELRLPMFNERYRWLDPLVWARKGSGVWGKNKLVDVAPRLGIDIGTAHRATDDAIATGRVLLAMRSELPPVTMTELLRRQEHYHRQQQEEMRKWFKKKGIPFRE